MKLFSDLEPDVYARLCACGNTKDDIKFIALSYYRNRTAKGKTLDSEDALVMALEHLDCNSQFIDITRDEYDDIVAWLDMRI